MEKLKEEWFTWLTLFFVTLFAYGHNYWFNSWHFKWTLTLAVAALFYADYLGKKIHWSVTPTLAYTLLNGVWIFSFRDSPYGDFPLLDQFAFSKSASYTTISALLLVSLVSLVTVRSLRSLWNAYGALCLANSLYVISQSFFVTAYHRGGFIGNASMNACLIAFTYPMLRGLVDKKIRCDWVDWFYGACLVFPIIAVILSSTSMGLGVLIVTLLSMWISDRFKQGPIPWKKYLVPGVLALVPILGLSYLALGKDIFQDSGRFYTWRIALEWLIDKGNPLLGQGAGSTELLLPMIQSDTKLITNEWFIWMHNDWLQLFFEQGLVGLILFGMMFYQASKKAFKKPALFGVLIGFAFCALGNYPLHSPILAVAGVLTLALCFRGDEVT